MEALRATYEDSSSDSESDSESVHFLAPRPLPEPEQSSTALPPPPLSLLNTTNSVGAFDYSSQSIQPNRVRCFPHIEGNFALHVYIPVSIPLKQRREPALLLERIAARVPELHAVDIDIPLYNFIKDDQKFEQVVLGREFHVSLGRTVPIRVHQRDSVVAMLRQRLKSQSRYWIDFSKWEVFVNDDHTRTFLSVEVTAGGLPQIRKQIEAVNEAYKLHNLPEFYKDPRPHISVAWAVGDISSSLKRIVEEEMKRHNAVGGVPQKNTITSVFGGISCKIGNKTYEICKVHEG